MKDVIENLFGFIYSLSMGDYFFFIGTFLLIVLFIYIIYLIKSSDEEKPKIDSKKTSDSFDLEAVTKAIEKDYKPENIRLTPYEEEQEDSAIISYEELVKNKDKVGVGYDDDYVFETPSDISVKKIDINNPKNNLTNEPKMEVKLMSYDKEEDFLKALKELQQNLSH
jgi:Ca2+/Na+ antiporter